MLCNQAAYQAGSDIILLFPPFAFAAAAASSSSSSPS
jgi:hypothetical protein